jgi:glycosyltransferase involved in cell wall biosynthesis
VSGPPSEESLHLGLDVTAIPVQTAGAGYYVAQLVRALANRGDLSLAVVTRRDDAARWRVGEKTTTFAVCPVSVPGRLVFGEVGLARALKRRVHPDVFHGPHYSLPARSSFPAVVTVHDLTLWDRPEWHARSKVAFFRRALRLAASRADVVIVPSAATADAYRAHFGDAVPVRVIPHGVDHDRFTTDEPASGSDQAVLTRLGIQWPYVLSVATNEPRKNLPSLVSAFSKLAARSPELRLVLAGGSGWKNDELEVAISTGGVASRVLRTGYLGDNDIPALLRRAAAVAYPAFVEGFGLPVLEALACGAPLVTSENTAMSEITGDAALLVEPSDVDGLADALSTLISGGEEVARRRRHGIERAAGYTWELSAARHVEAYRLAAGLASSRFTRRPA